jgi:hypothetical protein
MNIKIHSPYAFGAILGLACTVSIGCGTKATPSSDSDDGAGSEIATSAVSGALNNSAGSKLGFNSLPRERQPSGLDWLLDKLNPVSTAWAATWTCTGGSLNPAFNGPATYVYTPVSCSVAWGTGKTASAAWDSTFTLAYGSNCDTTHANLLSQAANCDVTRTTSATGNTRTITGPNGNSYAVMHNTQGQGTGWDQSVTPAPNNNGLVAMCGASGCSSGLKLSINGSHLTGTLTAAGGTPTTWWDHTVSTGAAGIDVTISGTSRIVTGTVMVQHNLAKFTSTTTFNNVTYDDANCCFPTGGSVTTTFSKGPHLGKTETLTFGGAGCGEAKLTKTDGSNVAFTLQHCI